MKTIITSVFFILALVAVGIASEGEIWFNNLEKAKQLSLRKKKLIVIVVKDDSCWSQKLEKLVKDFSSQHENASLYTFCVLSSDSFLDVYLKHGPNVILMHPRHGVVSKIGYMPMDIVGFGNYLKAQLENFEKIKDTALNAKNYDSKELEKVFLLSRQMGCSAFQKQLLDEADKRLDTAFFAFEKYEMLLNKFPYEDEIVKAAREEVELKDPKNIQKYHLRLAILEFLTLSDTNHEAKDIVKPLLGYIKIYGQKDKKNLWKIYMTISQFFLGKKDYYEALLYARLSHKKAPRSVKHHVQASIKYLRQKVNLFNK